MNNKVIVICETTYHGNTIKVANAIAKRLECDVIGFDEALESSLEQYEVVGLGSGIYFKMHHPKLLDIASRLNNRQKAFIFSTHGSPFLGKYHKALKDVLYTQGVSVVGEFDCKGYDNTGPFIIVNGGNKGRPHEGDLMKADRFIKSILPNYCYQDLKASKGKYVEIHDGCINCQKCMKVCPMHVFEFSENQVKPTFEDQCTHCSLCVDACPKHVISIHHSFKNAIGIAITHKDKVGLEIRSK